MPIWDSYNCILQHYTNEGVVEVVKWNPSTGPYVWQLAQMNECTTRYVNRYKYVMHIDTDEYLIPMREENLWQMLDNLEKSANKIERMIGAFLFQNSFFYTFYKENPSWKIEDLNLTTLKYTSHGRFYGWKDRSKLVVLPEHVSSTMIHTLDSTYLHGTLLHGRETLQVSHGVAYLHHYRTHMAIGLEGGALDGKTGTGRDRRALIWAQELTLKMKQVLEKLRNKNCL